MENRLFGNITMLIPRDGYKLTQSKNVSLSERIICEILALGKNDDESNWKEITNEEAEIMIQDMEIINKQMMDEYEHAE